MEPIIKNLTDNEVLIIGDSFAYERHNKNSWLYILNGLLTGNESAPRGKGFPGCSWWSARKHLMYELEESIPKVLIICHTEPHRLPSDVNLPLNVQSVMNESSSVGLTPDGKSHWSEEKRLAGKAYYEHLISIDFHVWTTVKWFEELDELTKKYNIPYVIHMHCFQPWEQIGFYVFKNGITVAETLWDSTEQANQWKIDPSVVFKNQSNVINHMTFEENKNLAEKLYLSIKDYNIGLKRIGLNLKE